MPLNRSIGSSAVQHAMANYRNSMLLAGAAMALVGLGLMAPDGAAAQEPAPPQDPSSLPSSPTPKPQAQTPPQQGDSSSSSDSQASPDAQPPDSQPSPPSAPAPDNPAPKPTDTKRRNDDDGPQWSSSKKADSDSKEGEDDSTSKTKKSAKSAANDDDADDSADASSKPKTAKPGVLAPESDPSWDPFHAAQDMDVGKFYMDKGDWDAAITRFEDAIRLRANFAKPREMMAEAYEKKGDKQEALRYYKEYLQVLPNAADAKRIQRKIEQLSAK